jgi:hypothetical protein
VAGRVVTGADEEKVNVGEPTVAAALAGPWRPVHPAWTAATSEVHEPDGTARSVHVSPAIVPSQADRIVWEAPPAAGKRETRYPATAAPPGNETALQVRVTFRPSTDTDAAGPAGTVCARA